MAASGSSSSLSMTASFAVEHWPTPGAGNASNEAGLMKSGDGREKPNKLGWAVGIWPTATANDFKGSGPTLVRKDGKMRSDRLDYAAARNWSTPRASDAEKGGPGMSFGGGGTPLPAMTASWPTIRAAESGQYQYSRGDSARPVATLTGAAMAGLSSPRPPHHPCGKPSLQPILSAFRRYRATTCYAMKSELRWLIRRAIRAEKAGERKEYIRPSFRRQLNPRFVEWLMAWPDHWTTHASTGSACSETELYRYKQLMRSALSEMPLPPAPEPMQGDLFGGFE